MADLIQYTDSGIVTMTENEIYAAVIEQYQTIDPNWNLDISTPDGYMAAWMAEQLRIAVEAVREAWNSKDPAKARGVQLNTIGTLTGTYRENGTPTQINGTCFGTEGTVITAGSIVAGEFEYAIDEDVTIGAGGSVSCTATCTTDGQIEPDIGSVTEIKTTIGGWASFTNTGLLVLGTDEESNTSFRIKRTRSVARPGNNQTDSTIGEIFAVEDVLRVAAYENPTNSAAVDPDFNPHGLPAHSMSYVVQGGDDEAVARAIYTKKNPGVLLNQVGVPVEVEIASEIHPSNSKLIKFGRPYSVDMVCDIQLADPLGNLPTNIEELIQDAIVTYSTGELIDEDAGFDSTGFDIGEDVPVRRIDTPINQVVGQYKGAYISSSTINGSTGLIAISFDEISTWTAANISVTVV